LYFAYTAALSFVLGLDTWQRLTCLAVPFCLFALASLETAHTRTATGIARDWAVPVAVLAGYWQMGWFARPHDNSWERKWLHGDRYLLDSGLRSSIESLSWAGPWILELSYLLLYAIPPACIALLYWRRERLHVDRFLTVFALGTLTAYALLPLIAVQSPRTVFPGQDLPSFPTIWRSINAWILNHLDISTSVFPSGHVAVAFSSALGIRRVLPGSPRHFGFFLALAILVYAATVYGRYHYAADGAASILICLVASRAADVYDRLV